MSCLAPASPPETVISLRIFVVENHPDTRKYLTMYLEDLGHTVNSAQSMQEALLLLREQALDVLISDIGLPDGDGWELLRQAGLPSGTYAIAMSGYGMNADHARSKAAGYRHHVLKPFGPDDLDSLLAEAAAERLAVA